MGQHTGTIAVLASLAAGLSTGLGAVPLLLGARVSRRLYDGLLGFASGVMLAAAFFSLLLPALATGGILPTAAGLVAGTALLFAMDKGIPHVHQKFGGRATSLSLRQGMLMAGAITIHNFPEGLAVGAGFSADVPTSGFSLALAIALQNIPEGLAVAAPLRQAGLSPWRSLAVATASGLAEPLAAILGLAALRLVSGVLPFTLAFAGGAMLYVVSDEIIPESHSHGNEDQATFGVMSGFLLMMVLNHLLNTT